MLIAIATFSLAAALIVVLPGPDTLVVVRAVVRGGRRRALSTTAGVLTGLAIWVAVASLGLAAMLRASRDGYDALRVAGAIYLVWLGVQSLRRRRSGEVAAPRARGGLLGTGFVSGALTDLLNPKVGVFFVTFLPGFLPAGADVAALSLLLGAIYILETAAYFAVLLALAGRVTRWMSLERVRRRIDAITGTVLIGFGLRLALES